MRVEAGAAGTRARRIRREGGARALGSLRGRIDAEPADGDAAAYRDRLLARMHAHHEHYRSDIFSEEYGGGRASMGSAIHDFESLSGELLEEAKPPRRRWPWYVWLLLLIGFLLALSNAHPK